MLRAMTHLHRPHQPAYLDRPAAATVCASRASASRPLSRSFPTSLTRSSRGSNLQRAQLTEIAEQSDQQAIDCAGRGSHSIVQQSQQSRSIDSTSAATRASQTNHLAELLFSPQKHRDDARDDQKVTHSAGPSHRSINTLTSGIELTAAG
ncbi:hypothetical protein IE81DRAFT_94304 [Ceraceosorus guamensis]|uniref:Uncharacterized protein n=1 Tax=Ceraceosorus guamensis TaxID=1522189 RepID=A0A316W044_9BASI|nr:hypothetical protein IE81DRAFT_94304 [Ceraceosorus guamensis]PWN43287.1 hypothetical protein IE81DRAFT_94304 [Ceraceosorus guamensis]